MTSFIEKLNNIKNELSSIDKSITREQLFQERLNKSMDTYYKELNETYMQFNVSLIERKAFGILKR